MNSIFVKLETMLMDGRNLIAAFFFVAILASCSPYPRDMEGTLEKVQGKVLKVGLSAYDSTANASGRTVEFEIALTKQIALELDAKIEWVRGSQSELVELLSANDLDMVIGGYTSPSPFEKEISFTRPYILEKIKVLAPPGKALPEELKDLKVFVTHHLAAHYVRKKGGIPIISKSLPQNQYIAGSEEELKMLNRPLIGKLLHEEKFVIGVAKGENAFLIKLETIIDKHGRTE